jgi:hypothetical protein
VGAADITAAGSPATGVVATDPYAPTSASGGNIAPSVRSSIRDEHATGV